MIEQKIEDLVAAKFAEEDFADCFLVEIKLQGSNVLKVFIDNDAGLVVDQCRRVSRYLESYLDEEQWLGEQYTLEVSSPGIDRPLRLKRQYQKNIGRTLLVETKEGLKREGVLVEVVADGFFLEELIITKVKKKKKKEIVKSLIPFDTVEKAKVKISFKKR